MNTIATNNIEHVKAYHIAVQQEQQILSQGYTCENIKILEKKKKELLQTYPHPKPDYVADSLDALAQFMEHQGEKGKEAFTIHNIQLERIAKAGYQPEQHNVWTDKHEAYIVSEQTIQCSFTKTKYTVLIPQK